MDGQMTLDIFAEALPEENQKAIKKLSKLTGRPQSEFIDKSLEELQGMIEAEANRIREKANIKKGLEELGLEFDETADLEMSRQRLARAKEVSDIKKKMEELGLTYDELLGVEANKKAIEEAEELKKNPSFLYPFKIYFKGHDIQQPDHIFEEGQRYTEKQVIERMFKHGFMEFSGQVKLEYVKDENLLVPNFTSQKHG